MFLYFFLTIIFVLALKSLFNYSSTKKKEAKTHETLSNSEICLQLPDEILSEIFSRMPAKSVGKFRCLSKTYHLILSSPHFINLHLSHQERESLFLMTSIKSFRVITLPFENPTISKEFYVDISWTRVIGSCNGLVLLFTSFDKDLFLINPIIHDLIEIPRLFLDRREYRRIELVGFGYDCSTNDYKIVVVHLLYATDLKTCDTLVDLFSVKSGVWKSITHSLDCFDVCGSFCGAYMNGSLHWFANQYNSETSFGILAFNLATEAFYNVEIPLPLFGLQATCSVFVCNGCLCIVTPLCAPVELITDPNGKIEVWMMEEYGKVTSWTRLSTIDSDGKWGVYVPLCFSRNDEIALVTNKKAIVVYNLRKKTVTDVVVDGAPTFCHNGCAFTGSLVSLEEIASSS